LSPLATTADRTTENDKEECDDEERAKSREGTHSHVWECERLYAKMIEFDGSL
jgi:hypothetical protein